MKAHHRQGRPGANARVGSRGVFARRVVLTLAQVCRDLEAAQTDGEAQAACREVRLRLLAWADEMKSPPAAAASLPFAP